MSALSSESTLDEVRCTCRSPSEYASEHVPRLSIVAACFNEVGSLETLHARTKAVCRELDLDYELILVNDGSTDETWNCISELCREDESVVGINLSRNFGQELAITAGMHESRGELVVLMDSDLQDPPELLPDMLREIEAGADVVYAQRCSRRGETLFKRMTAWGFYRVLEKVGDVPVPRDTGNFRLMRRSVVDVLIAMPEGRRFTRGLVAWAGFKQVALPFDRPPRLCGTSHWPTRRMVALAIDAIVSLSTHPLRLAWGFAAVSMALAFISIVASVATFAWVSYETGLALLILGSATMIGSLQLASIAILGEYVARIYREVLQRPTFVVERKLRRRNAHRATAKV